MTREDLARKSGVSVRQLYNIEHALCVPRRATRVVIALVLRCRVQDIDWPTTAMKEAAA